MSLGLEPGGGFVVIDHGAAAAQFRAFNLAVDTPGAFTFAGGKFSASFGVWIGCGDGLEGQRVGLREWVGVHAERLGGFAQGIGGGGGSGSSLGGALDCASADPAAMARSEPSKSGAPERRRNGRIIV